MALGAEHEAWPYASCEQAVEVTIAEPEKMAFVEKNQEDWQDPAKWGLQL